MLNGSDATMQRLAVQAWLEALSPEDRAAMIERVERALQPGLLFGSSDPAHAERERAKLHEPRRSARTAIGSGVVRIRE